METMRKSAPTVAPWWLGYLFLLPLRRLWDGAARLTAGRLAAGDTVLELGPAMGFHTLDLARMVGPTGRVIACDVQEKMLAVLRDRLKAGDLASRVECRLAGTDDPAIDDLRGEVDFALLYHVIHETGDPARFLGKVARSLRPGGLALLCEPKGHVTAEFFARELSMAQEAGLRVVERPSIRFNRAVWLAR